MKLGSFGGGRIVIIDDDEVVEVTDFVSSGPLTWPPIAMVKLIADFTRLKSRLNAALRESARTKLSAIRLETPIQWPNKLVAFPANYHAHIDEMRHGAGLISQFKADGQGFFLKSNSSLSGPNDPITLPDLPGRQIHHECELAVIIGKVGREIPRARALEHVFGYSCLIDVVVRGKEERVMRKSYDTFCPVGPYIVTADEIPAYDDIDLELSVNGELRQKANTRDLIVDVPGMICMASAVMTLYPGDIIATGTPEGVGPIEGGDKVTITIAKIGSMMLDVVQSKGGRHEVWEKSGQAVSEIRT